MSSFLESLNSMETVLQEVRAERKRQDALWGIQNHSMLTWLPILMEEAGEVAEAMNEWIHTPDGSLEEVSKELVQVAAVAVAWVERINRYAGDPKP